ncbi:MAG: hypothetical protein ACRDLB_04565 [Actinomycetota bacterium]
MRRVLPAAILIAALALPLWALGESRSVGDSRDTKGLLDVRKVKVQGKKRQPRWTFVTFKAWSKGRVFDRGYANVYIDTFGDARADYYALVRSTGKKMQALLFRDRKKRSDRRMGYLKVWKPGARKVTVRVALGKLRIPRGRIFYRWFAQTIMTGQQCRRVCFDRVPDRGSVRMFLREPPQPTPTPTIPTPTATPEPSASPSPTPSS